MAYVKWSNTIGYFRLTYEMLDNFSEQDDKPFLARKCSNTLGELSTPLIMGFSKNEKFSMIFVLCCDVTATQLQLNARRNREWNITG